MCPCINRDYRAPFKHMAIADHVPGAGKMVVQPGGEGAGEADLLEQTSPSQPNIASLEAASDFVEG